MQQEKKVLAVSVQWLRESCVCTCKKYDFLSVQVIECN